MLPVVLLRAGCLSSLSLSPLPLLGSRGSSNIFDFYKLNLGSRSSCPLTCTHRLFTPLPAHTGSLPIPSCPWQPHLSNSLLFFLPWLSLDQDECLMGTHDCSWKQFCVNTLGSFYCVNHTVLCAEGYILNAHRKCVGKLEPLPAAHVTAVCSAPRQPMT